MCGRCKIKLESGDVEQLATDGLSGEDIENGYVLACSSIPKSDIVLSKAPRN
jgi:ferredoxin